MRARSINVGMFAAAVGGVMGLMCGSLCGCDGSKAPVAAGGAGVGAGGPKRVDAEAETARLMAQMPAETDGRRRVLDVADDLKKIIDEVRSESGRQFDNEMFLDALSGYNAHNETAETRSLRLYIVNAIDRRGGALHYGAMAKGSMASDVRFVPIDGSTRYAYRSPVTYACFARMRVSLDARDVRAFRESLDAVVAMIGAMDLRSGYVDRASADVQRGSLYRELCALMQARNEPVVHAAVAEALKRLGPRDAEPSIEATRAQMLDWAASIFLDPARVAELRVDPTKFYPEYMRTREWAEMARPLGAKGALELGTYEENVRAINAACDWARDNVTREPWQLRAGTQLKDAVPEAEKLVLVNFMEGSARMLVVLPEATQPFGRGLNVRLAAEQYRLTQPSYPASLEAMNPDEATRAGWRDPHADALMRYEVYDEGHRVRIWSVGPNGKDENGKGDDVVVFEK